MLPHLIYFNVRGRAEAIRLILEETGTAYTERRVTVEEWPTLKATLDYGQLPVYTEGDLVIHQSHAICRHLARRFNLYGDDEADRIRCDIVEETFVDAQNNIGTFFWNPEFEKLRDEYEHVQLPALMTRLEKLFLSNPANSGYWAGTRLSYVDFLAWHFLDYVRPFSQKTLDQFSALAAFKHRIESRPAIVAYLGSERRPRTLTVPVASCPFGGTPETS